MRITFFVLSLVLLGFGAAAQVPVVSDQFRINLPAPGPEVEDDPIDFFELPYRYPTIDLRSLKDLAEYPLPDSIKVSPPNLSGFRQVTALIGIIGPVEMPAVIVWLAGDYESNHFTLFVDQNQDRDFTNDIRPKKIRRGEGTKTIMISTEQGDQFLKLKPPAKIPEIEVVRPTRKISNGFSIALSVGVGVGQLAYQYDDLNYGFPTNYDVQLVEKMARISASYDISNFQFGTTLAIQNHFFYTSTLSIKQGEPIRREIPDPNFPGRSTIAIFENKEEILNEDKHSPNRLQLGFYGAYKFNIKKTFTLQPMVVAGFTTYLDPQYNRLVKEDNEIYEMKVKPFYELGLRAEFTVGLERALFLQFAFSEERWEPEDFIPTIPHENFTSNFNLSRLSLGYRMKVFNAP